MSSRDKKLHPIVEAIVLIIFFIVLFITPLTSLVSYMMTGRW